MATALISLGIYLVSIPGELSWFLYGGDGGELITASYTLGIPHPPGYPSYVIFGKLFSLMPIGSVWFRYQLFSAAAMAVAAGFGAATAYRIAKCLNPGYSDRVQLEVIAVSCGLTMALSPLVWSQAVIAEVYALNMAIIAMLLWAIISKRSPLVVGLLLGLSLTTHLTSILLLPIAFFSPSTRPRKVLVLGIALGLAPFILLPFLALSDSPIRWGEPNSLSGWMWLVSARLYASNVLAVHPQSWLQRISEMNSAILLSIFLLVIPVVMSLHGIFKGQPGSIVHRFTLMTRKDRQILSEKNQMLKNDIRGDNAHNRVQSSRQIIMLVVAAIFYVIYAVSYRPADAVVLLLPVYLLLSLSIAYLKPQFMRYVVVFPMLMIAISATGYSDTDHTDIEYAARRILTQAPNGAILLSPGDETFSMLTYLLNVEKLREDVILIDSNMFQFDWYRQQVSLNDLNLTHLEYDHLSSFIAANALKYPICRAALFPSGSLECIGLPSS